MAESFVMYGVSSFKGFLITASSQLSICMDQESALYLFLSGAPVPVGGYISVWDALSVLGGRVSVWGALSLFGARSLFGLPCPC